MNIGESIKYWRTRKELTQKQLAEAADISEISIRKYEAGERIPKITSQAKIAAALGIPVSQLNDTLGWLKAPEYKPLERKLEQIGYTLGYNEDGYLWINYPDGPLDITMKDLEELDKDTDSYLLFKLEELRRRNTSSASSR